MATGREGFVSFQDFFFKEGPCSMDTCTFESDTCGWTGNNNIDNNYFQLSQAKFVATKTHSDHTSRSPSGHVMKFTPKNAVSNVKLTSPALFGEGNQCFSFWYLRSGTPTGISFQVVQNFQHNIVPNSILLWQSLHGYSMEQWISVNLDVNLEPKSNIVFVATKNGMHKSFLICLFGSNFIQCIAMRENRTLCG